MPWRSFWNSSCTPSAPKFRNFSKAYGSYRSAHNQTAKKRTLVQGVICLWSFALHGCHACRSLHLTLAIRIWLVPKKAAVCIAQIPGADDGDIHLRGKPRPLSTSLHSSFTSSSLPFSLLYPPHQTPLSHPSLSHIKRTICGEVVPWAQEWWDQHIVTNLVQNRMPCQTHLPSLGQSSEHQHGGLRTCSCYLILLTSFLCCSLCRAFPLTLSHFWNLHCGQFSCFSTFLFILCIVVSS